MTILGDFNIFWNVLLSFMLHYMGVVVVLTLTKLSGTFSVSIVSSCRKMLTVGLSCVVCVFLFPSLKIFLGVFNFWLTNLSFTLALLSGLSTFLFLWDSPCFWWDFYFLFWKRVKTNTD